MLIEYILVVMLHLYFIELDLSTCTFFIIVIKVGMEVTKSKHAAKQTKTKQMKLYTVSVVAVGGRKKKKWVAEILLALDSGLQEEGSGVVYPRSAPAAKKEALEEVWAGARCAIAPLSHRQEGLWVTLTHAHTHARMHPLTHKHTHTRTHSHLPTHTPAHTHTHPHSHT